LESCHAGGGVSSWAYSAGFHYNKPRTCITWVQNVSGHLPISFSDADKGKKTNVLVLFCFAGTKPQLMCTYNVGGGGIGNSIADDIFVHKTSVKARIASLCA